jgi:hypothetical protein
MRPDEYRRLYEACLAMAEQSTDADARARWLAMAGEVGKQFESEPSRKNSLAAKSDKSTNSKSKKLIERLAAH